MGSAEFEDLAARLERIERLLQSWVEPTIAERNRQLITADPERRKAANKELLSRKRRELKRGQVKQ